MQFRSAVSFANLKQGPQINGRQLQCDQAKLQLQQPALKLFDILLSFQAAENRVCIQRFSTLQQAVLTSLQ